MKSQIQLKNQFRASLGFTLSEILVTVAIAGTLSSIAYPSYIKQLKTSCQNQQESTLSQIMSRTQSFTDEYGSPPNGWNDLDKIATLMTSEGPAKGNSFSNIDLPSCNYSLGGSLAEHEFNFFASRKNIQEEPDKFNLVGCINVATGASDLKRGNGAVEAKTSELNCK